MQHLSPAPTPEAHVLLDTTQKDGYTLACALRGPDSGDNELKAVTTAVLRHFLGVSPGGAIVNSPERAQSTWHALAHAAKQHIAMEYFNGYSHHMNHWKQAMMVLGTPASLDYARWLHDAMSAVNPIGPYSTFYTKWLDNRKAEPK